MDGVGIFKFWTMLINNNGVEMFIEKVQVRVIISGQDILSTAYFNAVKPNKEGLQRRSVHCMMLRHRLVPMNVGPLVVGG